MGDIQPGDSIGPDATAGWQRSDGTWTYNQDDPDFDDRPEYQQAKGQHPRGRRGGADGADGGDEPGGGGFRDSRLGGMGLRGWGRNA